MTETEVKNSVARSREDCYYENEKEVLYAKIDNLQHQIEKLRKEISDMRGFDREILNKFNDMMAMVLQLQQQVMELSKHIDNGWKQDLLDKLSNIVIDIAKSQNKFNNKMLMSQEVNDHELEVKKQDDTTKIKLKKWELLLLIFGATGLATTVGEAFIKWILHFIA